MRTHSQWILTRARETVFRKWPHFVTNLVPTNVLKRDSQREGTTIMDPFWNHWNHGNNQCGEKAMRASECRNSSDEESRGTAASADQLWMVWSPQCWHNGPGSAHSQNINRLTQPRVETMELILQLFRAVRKRLSDLDAHQSLFKRYLRWQLTLWTWCVGGSWTSRWWHPLLSPRTLWTPHAAQERAPSNNGWYKMSN